MHRLVRKMRTDKISHLNGKLYLKMNLQKKTFVYIPFTKIWTELFSKLHPQSSLKWQSHKGFYSNGSFLRNSRKYGLRSLRKTPPMEGPLPIGPGSTSGQLALNLQSNLFKWKYFMWKTSWDFNSIYLRASSSSCFQNAGYLKPK